MSRPSPDITALSDVVRIARDLIRIDTSNFGGGQPANEHLAADLIEAELAAVGVECGRYEAEPGRTNLVARIRGRNGSLPALLLHGHLDVVPADASRWSVDPFAGVIADGMLWGRGAIDMKNMVAMIVAAVRDVLGASGQPERDVVLAFFADEEAGCALGSQWLVSAHPELFDGVDFAVGEGGGYSVPVGAARAYLMNTGEKGALWLRLTAEGRAGHASIANDDNAVAALAGAVARVQAIEWPTSTGPTTTILFERLRALAGLAPEIPAYEVAGLVGPSAARLRAGLQSVANVTMIQGGYKENVVPESATALIDCRFLPGQRDEALAAITAAAGPSISISIEMDLIAMEAPFGGDVVDILSKIIDERDPGAVILPHVIPGGTDAKALSRLGITGYGFIPLLLPNGFNFPGMFHGVDERVPLESLEFGAAVITDLLRRV